MYKVLVTGGCGFIGSNFILRLHEKVNCKILNIDKLTYSGNLDNLHSIKSNYSFVKADICDNELIKKSIKDFRPNYIINFAAESHVDRSIDSYSDFINTNILGTINLLECSLQYFKKVLIKILDLFIFRLMKSMALLEAMDLLQKNLHMHQVLPILHQRLHLTIL